MSIYFIALLMFLQRLMQRELFIFCKFATFNIAKYKKDEDDGS